MRRSNEMAARRFTLPRFLALVVAGGKGLTPSRGIVSRFIATALACAGLVLASAPAFAGPVGFNAFGGMFSDPHASLAGGGVRIGFGSITFNPNAEYIFDDNTPIYTLNLDGTISVIPLGVGSFYAGAGLTWFTIDPDNGDSSTDTGFNVLAGFGLNAVPLKPYGQLKEAFVNDDANFSFSIGVRF